MQNKTNYIIGALVIIVLAGIGYYIFAPSGAAMNNFQQQINSATTTDVTATSSDQSAATGTAQTINNATSTQTNTPMKSTYTLKLETSLGNITLELNPKIAPKTVANFVKLATSGFYDGTKFHRVISGFMIQGGDPLSKDESQIAAWGTGGPGYKFDDEITDPTTYQIGYKRGILAMANSGPNTNGSQFFIMHKDTPLPPSYTIFGKIPDGDAASFATLDAIAGIPTNSSDRPLADVVIKKVIVE